MVLWTKQSFEGDLKIEYDYTRIDNETRCVNILYIQATGSGKGPYARDISQWNELRKVPAMATYFNHMHAYHISYAAFPNSGENRVSYIRARRYLPEGKGLKGTELAPDYDPQGFFAQGVTHHITVIKKDRDLFHAGREPGAVGHYPLPQPAPAGHHRGPRRPAPHVHPLGALPEFPDQHPRKPQPTRQALRNQTMITLHSSSHLRKPGHGSGCSPRSVCAWLSCPPTPARSATNPWSRSSNPGPWTATWPFTAAHRQGSPPRSRPRDSASRSS